MRLAGAPISWGVCEVKDVDRELGRRLHEGDEDYARAVRGGLYCALGDGVARIADVLAWLRQRDHAGWYVIEQDVMLDGAPDGVPDRVERSAAFARAHGGS